CTPLSASLFPYTTLVRSSRRLDTGGTRRRHRLPRQACRNGCDQVAEGRGERRQCESLRKTGLGGGKDSRLLCMGFDLFQIRRSRSEEHTSELQSRENLVC